MNQIAATSDQPYSLNEPADFGFWLPPVQLIKAVANCERYRETVKELPVIRVGGGLDKIRQGATAPTPDKPNRSPGRLFLGIPCG